jgi:hypothetical protein
MAAVVMVVGGVTSELRPLAQSGPRRVVVPKDEQAEALQFLLQHAFEVLKALIRPQMLRQVDYAVVVESPRVTQDSRMTEVLQRRRIDHGEAGEFRRFKRVFSPSSSLVTCAQASGVNSFMPTTAVDIYRRNVQRSYLDTIDEPLNSIVWPSAEVRALLGGELRAPERQLRSAQPAVTDDATATRTGLARQVGRILDSRPTGRAGTGGSR